MRQIVPDRRRRDCGVHYRNGSLTPDRDRPAVYRLVDRRPARGVVHGCTTALVRHVDDAKGQDIPCSIDLLLNGYIPRLAYERGHMPTDAPLEVVMKRYAISAKAKAAGVAADFSQRIRVGLGKKAADEG